jgi:hypothetical protein
VVPLRATTFISMYYLYNPIIFASDIVWSLAAARTTPENIAEHHRMNPAHLPDYGILLIVQKQRLSWKY